MPTQKNKILSGCLLGLTGVPVEIETDLHASLPSILIVGLPDKSVDEAKERVRSAIRASGRPFPRGRVIVNLAPAGIKKQGSLYDLPIALSILCAQGEISYTTCSRKMFLGELALDGSVRPVPGILSLVKMARSMGLTDAYVPVANAFEASLVEGIKIRPVQGLGQLVSSLASGEPIGEFRAALENLAGVAFESGDAARVAPVGGQSAGPVQPRQEVTFHDIWGQEQAKRALLIAAAGRHNVMLIGPPGSGKTMLAKAMHGVLPPLARREAVELAEIYSVAGRLDWQRPLMRQRPFRAPHHTASTAALVGGGNPIKPGEISLAHQGVLYLDEISEFSRPVLEALREPLEERSITVTRVAGRYTFPADFCLVATMNPCPCGYRGSVRPCRCSPAMIRNYWQKISGPLLDRIDIFVWVSSVPVGEIGLLRDGGLSVAEKPGQPENQEVADCFLTQMKRQRGPNAGLTPEGMMAYCVLDRNSRVLVGQAVEKMGLSNRACAKVIKVARTIADWQGLKDIQGYHIGEALQYRQRVEGAASPI